MLSRCFLPFPLPFELCSALSLCIRVQPFCLPALPCRCCSVLSLRAALAVHALFPACPPTARARPGGSLPACGSAVRSGPAYLRSSGVIPRAFSVGERHKVAGQGGRYSPATEPPLQPCTHSAHPARLQ